MFKKRWGVLLAVFVFIAPVAAHAVSYDVTASVLAPLPPTTPIVTAPNNNAVIQNDNVYVTGTCTVVVPNLIVVLERNGQTAGSGNCTPEGTFRILVGLVLGTNVFRPKFVTITGQVSGYGDSLTLNYVSSEAVPTATTDATEQAELLHVTMPYDFVTYSDKVVTTLKYVITGGVAPYRVTINWGDNTQRAVSQNRAGEFTIEHQYRRILPPSNISIQVIDASGSKVIVSRALVSFRQGVYVPPAQPIYQSPKQWYGVWATGIVCFSGVLLLTHFKHKDISRWYKRNKKLAVKSPGIRGKKHGAKKS